MPALLEVLRVEAQYRWTKVLHGVDFAVETGGITTILGANGAGKTTTLRAVCGMIKTSGEIRFDGQRIDGRATEDIVRLGIAHVPEGRGTFAELTVEDNLRIGGYRRRDGDGMRQDMERCFEYFPQLAERRRQRAGNLSGGEQQMLAVARGLMLRPRLLMLDEPSLGLAPVLTKEVFRILGTIAGEEGTTVLLVEQNAKLALGLADYAYVLEAGCIVQSGEAEQMKEGQAVQRTYLGF